MTVPGSHQLFRLRTIWERVSSFRHQSWNSRFAALGDEAEGIFESTYPQGFVKFGLSRPPINLSNVPAFVRYTPDYLTAKGLVEAQGFGRDQKLKIKRDKMDALADWAVISDWRVDMFVWDTTNKRFGWIRMPELVEAAHEFGVWGWFPEGKQYVAIAATDLPAVWTDLGDKSQVVR